MLCGSSASSALREFLLRGFVFCLDLLNILWTLVPRLGTLRKLFLWRMKACAPLQFAEYSVAMRLKCSKKVLSSKGKGLCSA